MWSCDATLYPPRVQAKNWRLMAFGCLFLSAGFAAALVWQSARGTVVPWVVQVDNLGQAQAVAPAVADYRPTDPQVAFHLARFIEQTRGIPADGIVLRQNWLRAYDYTTDRGAAALNDITKGSNPGCGTEGFPAVTGWDAVRRECPAAFCLNRR